MPKLSGFRITKRAVDALPTDKDATYRDAELKGFAVRVKPSGSKTYLAVYRNHEGRTRSLALGQHGELTADQARKLAQKALGDVRSGLDPAEERQLERKAQTVADLCTAYIEAAHAGNILGRRGSSKKASTLATDIGRIKRHILPLLGKRKVRDLTPTDISKFVRDVASGRTATDIKTGPRGRAIVEGGQGAATRTVGLLGGIMSFAISEGIIAANPCRGVRKYQPKHRQIRLDASDYAALGEAFRASEQAGEPWQTLAAFRLLALTGCRLGEVGKLRWADVDLAGHALRLSDSKTGRSVRPLGSAAAALLRSLDQTGDYVFPAARIKDAPYGGFPKAWKRILSRAVVPPDSVLNSLTPHGLRHGFASTAGDLGMSEISIAALLGHATASVTGRYVHAIDTTLIAAADRVASRIAAQMDGTEDSGTVVPIRRA